MHPFKDKTVKEVETDIIKIVKKEKPTGFSLSFLELRLGETCLYKSIEEALNSLVKKERIVHVGYIASFGESLYDLVEEE